MSRKLLSLYARAGQGRVFVNLMRYLGFFKRLFSNITLLELLLIWFTIHIFLISFPQTPVFDETYYTKAAQDLINRVPSNPEHPFLGKVWGSLGILLFGNNFFGWRIVIIVFGLLSMYVFYLLLLKYLSERQALLATAFLGFDYMFFLLRQGDLCSLF